MSLMKVSRLVINDQRKKKKRKRKQYQTRRNFSVVSAGMLQILLRILFYQSVDVKEVLDSYISTVSSAGLQQRWRKFGLKWASLTSGNLLVVRFAIQFIPTCSRRMESNIPSLTFQNQQMTISSLKALLLKGAQAEWFRFWCQSCAITHSSLEEAWIKRWESVISLFHVTMQRSNS